MTRTALALVVVLAALAVEASPSVGSGRRTYRLSALDKDSPSRRPDPLALAGTAADAFINPHRNRVKGPRHLAAVSGRLGDSTTEEDYSEEDSQYQLGDADDPWRLPKNMTPVSYELTIKPMLYEDFLFHGALLIYINVHESSDLVVLHALDLHIQIDSVFLYNYEFPYFTLAESVDILEDATHQMIGIDFNYTLTAGSRYIVEFRGYDGYLNDDMIGFYRSSYTLNGEKKWLATTQFESTAARMAFPCFDEPEYKARFNITIIHDREYSSMANMPLIASDYNISHPGYVTDRFQTSVPMSTYLVAFVISDFEYVSNPRTYFKTWSEKGLVGQAVFAEDIGPISLALEANWTGIPYTLPKMDEVAIPDFSAGAMENWGLATYREKYLLTLKTTTTYMHEQVATVICHELGHQWTGDLVTLDWWSYTWLNEGFATYFEHYICAQILPDWNLIDQFVPIYVQTGMESDSNDTQHAMDFDNVHSAARSESIFDYVEYNKAGSVLRMFQNMLGLDVFKAGIHRYLVINSFKNTDPQDLFSAMSVAAEKADVLPSGYDFEDIAYSWANQPGVPVVNVTRNSSTITFSQERFFYTEPYVASLRNVTWWLPLNYFTKSSANWTATLPINWLMDNETSASFSYSSSTDEWLIVNPSVWYYYRVNYQASDWKLIAEALSANISQFAPASRCQLLNDSLAMGESGMLNYSIAMSVANFLGNETAAAPWMSATTSLAFLKGRLANTGAYDSFKMFVQNMTSKAFKEVGYNVEDSDTHEDRMLRYYVVPWACDSGTTKCVSKATELLEKWLDNPDYPLHPDILAPTLCYGVRGGGSKMFSRMRYKWLNTTDDADARYSYLSALACSSNDTLLTGLMKEAIDDDLDTNKTEIAEVFYVILNRPENRDTMWSFIKEYLSEIESYFDDDNATALELLEDMIGSIRTRQQLYEMRLWITDNLGTTSTMYDDLEEALIAVDKDLITWYDKYYDTVADWLSTNYPASSSSSSSTTTTTEASDSTETTDSSDTTTTESSDSSTTTESSSSAGLPVCNVAAIWLLLATLHLW